MKRNFRFRLIFLPLALLAAGCEVGPDYKPPHITVAPAFVDSAATQPASVVDSKPVSNVQWWTTFNDPELNSLIDRAMKSNLDLRSAQSRLLQARAQQGVVGSELWPEINADGGYQHARGSNNVVIPVSAFIKNPGGAPSVTPKAKPDVVTAAQTPPTPPEGGPQSPLGDGGLPGVTTDVYQAGFDASWEIDVFGGVRRSIEAADADSAAALEDRRDVTVSLMAEVARDYIQLRMQQRQAKIAVQNLNDEQDILTLTRSQYQAGFATQLDVARQAAEVAATAATLPALETYVRQSIHALGILLAQDPDSLSAELSADAAIPPVPGEVPVGVPADLLRRRPDIRRAERQLAAANARVGVATADYFPRFSVTGSFGLDSTNVKHLIDWNSRYFALSPGATWPIFDAGRIQANVQVQKELTRQAAYDYQSAVLNALREVEDSLAAYRNEQTRRLALNDEVGSSRQALDLARQQYQKGVIDFFQVLDAQRSVLQAQDLLAQSDGAVSLDLVSLYKALGGGWEIESPARKTHG